MNIWTLRTEDSDVELKI